jgi:hypothetical protein
MGRRNDVERLYSLLDRLERNVGGKRRLKNGDG